jgi:hypothetical protein
MNNIETNINQQQDNYVKTKSELYVPKTTIETNIYTIIKPTEEEIMQQVQKDPASRIQIIQSGTFLDKYVSIINANNAYALR